MNEEPKFTSVRTDDLQMLIGHYWGDTQGTTACDYELVVRVDEALQKRAVESTSSEGPMSLDYQIIRTTARTVEQLFDERLHALGQCPIGVMSEARVQDLIRLFAHYWNEDRALSFESEKAIAVSICHYQDQLQFYGFCKS